MDFLIYLFCLAVGLFFTLLTAVFGHVFGGDHGHVEGSGGHAEAGADASDAPGISALSPTVIACFAAAFGGFGLVLRQIDALKSPWLSAPLAMLGAWGVAGALLFVLRQLFQKTQSSSESKVGSLVGQTATILTPVPQDGVGEIAYVQAGTRYTAPARSEKGVAIAGGRAVKITRVVGTQFYVDLV